MQGISISELFIVKSKIDFFGPKRLTFLHLYLKKPLKAGALSSLENSLDSFLSSERAFFVGSLKVYS